jgi:hypothetical protein
MIRQRYLQAFAEAASVKQLLPRWRNSLTARVGSASAALQAMGDTSAKAQSVGIGMSASPPLLGIYSSSNCDS